MRHPADLLKGLAALIVAAVLVVAVPAGLVAYVGWPLPTSLPTFEGIGLALRSGINPQLLINTLAVVVWFTWAQIVAALAAEVIAAVGGRTARRLPVFPGLQTAATHLVAAITIAVATLGPLRAVPAAATPLEAVIVATAHPTLTFQPHSAPNPYPEITTPRRGSVGADHVTYRVARFDTLWKVAETTLGDGRRWQEIRQLNLGRVMADGQTITVATDRLTPGWQLLLPDGAHTHLNDTTPDQAADTVVVEPGDNFWTIAEQTLEGAWGRPPSNAETAGYWGRVVDANRHRLSPPYDPNLIHPGQNFDLPTVPADPRSASSPTLDPSGAPISDRFVVEQGDNLWTIAEAALTAAWERPPSTAETADYWRRVVDANRHRLLAPYDPNLIYPGQTIHLPTIPGDPRAPGDSGIEREGAALEQEPTAPPDTGSADVPLGTPAPADGVPQTGTGPAPLPTVPSTEAPLEMFEPPEAAQATDQEPITPAPEDSDEGGLAGELLPIASTVAGVGVLAAGLIALLHRLRSAQLRHRRPRTIPTPPPPDTAKVEAAIRAGAGPTATEFIDLALRAMAHNVTASHIPSPQVVGVLLNPEQLRLLLWTPHHHPPPGWHLDDVGRSWTLPADTNPDKLRQLADGVPAPYPTLVTVGHGDRTQLLLDLEYLGAVQLTGDPADVTATCHTMATELATSPIADTLQVVCVGFGHDLAHLERIRVVDHLEEILGEVDQKAATITHLAAASPLEGRLSPASGDSWDPIVILDPSATPPEGSGHLLATAHAGRGVAVVVGYPTGERWRLHLVDGTVRIDPLGYTFARRNLTPTEQAAVAGLVAAAKDIEGIPADPAEHAFLSEPTEEASAQVQLFTGIDKEPVPDTGAAPNLEVRVLGTLRVEGLDARFPLRKCTELVTYLTFHRNGVEADTLMEALWPEQPPDYPRLNRHTSRTRTTLGHTPDGQPYLPYITDGIYRISPQLGSDLDRFTHHLREADRTSGGNEVEHLRAALELVEGTPFTGAGNAYTWAHTDGIITHTIVAIDNTAHRLAQLALEEDAPDQAAWAARKGLTATGACEECYRNLMRAAIAEGGQTALEAVYTELLAVVDADQGPDASGFLDPETIELYEAHNRRRRRQAG